MPVQTVSAKNKSCLFQGDAPIISYPLSAKSPEIKTNVWEACISSVTIKFPTPPPSPSEHVLLGLSLNYVDKSPYMVTFSVKSLLEMETFQFHPIWYEFDFVSDTAIFTVRNLITGLPYTGAHISGLLVYHRKA